MTRLVVPPARERPAPRTIRRAVACCIVAALVAAACSSDDAAIAEPDPTDPPPTTDTTDTTNVATVDGDLAVIELAATAGDPFDRIAVTGLDGLPTDEIALWMRTPDEDTIPDDIFVPVYLDGDGNAELVVPFHPADPMTGGDVAFHFGDGDDTHGPIIEFSIGTMPPAPGAWNAFLDEFRAEIDRAADELGSNADELAATDFDDVPDELLPLKFALTYLDDGTENSLVGIYDSPLLTDDDRMLLDALTARIEPTQAFIPAGEPTGFRRPSTSPSPPVTMAVPSIARPAQSGDCRSANITVADAADLSDKLTAALNWEITEGGPVEMVLQDIGTVTTVGGFIPGVGWVVGAGGAVFSGIEALHNGIAGLYPSKITSLDAWIDTDEFREDFVLDGVWFDVTVVAESTGWNAAGDVGGTVLSGLSAGASGYLGQGLNVVEGLGLDLGLFTGENLAGQLIEDLSPTFLNFCPQQWEVDITGEPWSRASVVLDRFDTNDTARTYWPVDTGMTLPVEDTLRIEVNFERFRNQMVWKDFPVRVVPIRVSGPSEIEVDNPMELVDVDFTVENAHDISLELDADHGDWVEGEPTYLDGDPLIQRHTHIAAIDEEDFPYVIVARSASTSGLRANGDPPRVHTAVVRLRELIVTPNPGGVLTGNQLQFTATDRNGNPVEVEWSATGGTIDANGVYTAGDTPGTYTVTAVDVNNPDRRTTVTVEVDDGTCVVGTWRLRTQPFLDQFMQFVPMGADALEVGDQYVTEFRDDGSFEGRRENWTWAVTIPDMGIATTSIDSVERGTWSILPGVDGGPSELRINETSSDSTVSITVEAAGMTMGLPGGEQQFSDAGVSGQGPFSCSGNLMTLTASSDGFTITAELDRIG